MRTTIDPDEARLFAAQLERAAQDLRSLNRAASQRLLDMHGSAWNDARYVQFEKRFEAASTLLATFTERAEKYADYLRRKAKPIDRYLERNY